MKRDPALYWRVRWHSARPVQLALRRSLRLSPHRWIGEVSPEVFRNNPIVLSLQILCCSQASVPFARTYNRQRHLAGDLLPITDLSLITEKASLYSWKGASLIPERFQVIENTKDGLEILFTFPRVGADGTETLSSETNTTLHFYTHVSEEIVIDAKFDTKAMRYGGEVAF